MSESQDERSEYTYYSQSINQSQVMGDVETVETVEDRMQSQQIVDSINMMLDEEEEKKEYR